MDETVQHHRLALAQQAFREFFAQCGCKTVF
jgi:hypothetical protein